MSRSRTPTSAGPPPRAASTFLAAALAGLLAVLATPIAAPALTYEPVYPVSEIQVEYALDHPRHLATEEVLDLEVGLRATEEAYVAPRPVDRTVRMRLSALPRRASFGASALLHINQHIVSTFNRRGYNGVIVTVPDIEEGSGRDLRTPGVTRLRLRIWTGRISRVSSVADGERFGGLSVDERTDHAAHAWIRRRSPVRPGGPRGLLDIRALEDYAADLSRHPGRRVDAELEPGARTGTMAVNLRIAESKPWYAYAQYANTGTSTTTKNRETFGFVHSELLGRDDILRLTYTTGDFDEVHSIVGSYVAPFTLEAPRWRWRVASWFSQFDAEEAGFITSRFEGQETGVDAELIANLLQVGELFVDASAGVRWQRIEVANFQFDPNDTLRQTVGYLVPHAGLSASRDTTTSVLRASLGLQGGFTEAKDEELELLGNALADDDFALLTFDGSYSFFLEPLLDRQAWEDPETPESSTLAHEFALAVRGQWAFQKRLVPQFQQTAGGFYSVRGYKQSAAAGDNLLLGSAEYRLHLPRLFSPDPNPPEVPGMGVFRARPQHVWSAPDWDLIFRVFADAARVGRSRRRDSENHETLVSVGGGLELQVLRNLTLRADAGHVLSELDALDDVGRSTRGDTRAHLAATLLY